MHLTPRSPLPPNSHPRSLAPQLVSQYRKNVLMPFFAKQARAGRQPFNSTAYEASLNSFLGAQLGATLTNLSPPKTLQWWAVSVTARSR